MINKNIRVLIPNATGPSNVGDEAILYPLLNLLQKSADNMVITVLTSDPHLCKKEKGIIFDLNLYEWSMANSFSMSKKLFRSVLVFISYFLMKLKMEFLIYDKDLKRIINYYKTADLIVYVGGGSLRSVRGLKNSYILLIIMMIYKFANLYKTKKILTPSSFGPFSNNWHYKIVAKIIAKSDVVSFREIYSCNTFKKYSTKRFVQSSDFALLIENKNLSKRKGEFIVGFTIRNWLDKEEQTNLEKAYAFALYKLAQQVAIKIQPIVQVNIPNTNQHNDFQATKNVMNNLKKYHVKTNKEILITDLDSATRTYGKLNLLLGMRMHSNIIAATQGVPFVAIAYEYKTQGIARNLGVEEYSLNVEDVNRENLSALMEKAYRNRAKLEITIKRSLAKIRKKEISRWTEIFESHIY